jgi:hypothetical protein
MNSKREVLSRLICGCVTEPNNLRELMRRERRPSEDRVQLELMEWKCSVQAWHLVGEPCKQTALTFLFPFSIIANFTILSFYGTKRNFTSERGMSHDWFKNWYAMTSIKYYAYPDVRTLKLGISTSETNLTHPDLNRTPIYSPQLYS